MFTAAGEPRPQYADLYLGLERLRPSAFAAKCALADREMGDWPPRRIPREGVYGFCQVVRTASHLVQGLADQGMRHDGSWEFIRLGRYGSGPRSPPGCSRSSFTCCRRRTRPSGRRWTCTSGGHCCFAPTPREAYVGVDPAGLSPRAVVRLLVVDELFPRAVAYCLAEVERSLTALVEAGVLAPVPAAVRLARAARAAVSTADALSWDRDLRRLLDEVQIRCNAIDEAIAATASAIPAAGMAARARA